MKDAKGNYLYIGKAINIKNRVRSYFSPGVDNRMQIPYLINKIATIDWIATNTETESLILEANLVRTHKPPYNVELKDDKHFPYLKITNNEPFPRLFITRRVSNDKAYYFGPFTNTQAMRRIIELAKKIFKIRSCRIRLPHTSIMRPCINYSIHRCSGPCANRITEKEYKNNIQMLIQFLKGKRVDIIKLLEGRMEKAASLFDYEKAAEYRNQIDLISKSSYLQRVDLRTPRKDIDIFGMHETDFYIGLCILTFRQGILLSNRLFNIKREIWEVSKDSHEAVLLQYYQNNVIDPPHEIILPGNHGFKNSLIISWFRTKYSREIKITIPQQGQKKELVKMAEKNAHLHILQQGLSTNSIVMGKLQEILNLPRLPETIEVFDISNLGDKFCVAGMVHFKAGKPIKSQYRRFKIKSAKQQNDFAMLVEAVNRRLSRLENEKKPFPDLLLIDGGKGQLSVVLKSLAQYSDPPMVISLAKKEEILFSQYREKPVQLYPQDPVRKFVEHLRDEAHRWVISYHRTIRDKQYKKSSLERIPGIGPSKAKELLRHFGSLKKVKTSSIKELSKVKGFSKSTASKLREHMKE